MYHRLSGPAMEFDDGTKRWYCNGRLSYIDNGVERFYLVGSDGEMTFDKHGKGFRFHGYEVNMK